MRDQNMQSVCDRRPAVLCAAGTLYPDRNMSGNRDLSNTREVVCIGITAQDTCEILTGKDCKDSDNCMPISIAVDDGYVCEIKTRDNCEE